MAKPKSIATILASAKPREHSIKLCLAGHLAGQIEALEQQLAAEAGWEPSSLADTDPRVAIAEQIAKLQEQMRGGEVTFTFRALGAKAYSDLLAAHPGRTDAELFNPETLAPALIAACCVDPVMTEEEYQQLGEVLNAGQRRELEAAAWSVNDEATAVPFSLAVSAILAGRGGGK